MMSAAWDISSPKLAVLSVLLFAGPPIRKLTRFNENANASRWHSEKCSIIINEGVDRAASLVYPSVAQLTAESRSCERDETQ